MARPRRTAMAAGLLCLAPAMLVQLPAVAWQLADSWSGSHHDAVWEGRGHHGARAVRVHVTGSVPALLAPGGSSPIRLSLMNPNPRTVSIRRVRVTIVRVTAPRADGAHPCTVADFEVRQMRRGILRLPAMRFTDLAGLGLPSQDWPQLTMRNLPVNQDGCKGARITLRYRAHRVRRSPRWVTG